MRFFWTQHIFVTLVGLILFSLFNISLLLGSGVQPEQTIQSVDKHPFQSAEDVHDLGYDYRLYPPGDAPIFHSVDGDNPLPEVRKFKLSKAEQKCLIENAYWEAQNEGMEGLNWQIQTTLNRVKSDRWADNACDVVYQPYQFTWTLDQDKRGEGRLFNRLAHLDQKQKRNLQNIRNLVQNIVAKGYVPNKSESGEIPHHYVRHDIEWEYSDDLNKVKRVGDHQFYS